MGVSKIQEGTNINKHMQRLFSHSNLPLEFICNGKQDITIWTIHGHWTWNPTYGFASWRAPKWKLESFTIITWTLMDCVKMMISNWIVEEEIWMKHLICQRKLGLKAQILYQLTLGLGMWILEPFTLIQVTYSLD
jgi:hypothetical protein